MEEAPCDNIVRGTLAFSSRPNAAFIISEGIPVAFFSVETVDLYHFHHSTS